MSTANSSQSSFKSTASRNAAKKRTSDDISCSQRNDEVVRIDCLEAEHEATIEWGGSDFLMKGTYWNR
jgi:hypothetical protein